MSTSKTSSSQYLQHHAFDIPTEYHNHLNQPLERSVLQQASYHWTQFQLLYWFNDQARGFRVASPAASTLLITPTIKMRGTSLLESCPTDMKASGSALRTSQFSRSGPRKLSLWLGRARTRGTQQLYPSAGQNLSEILALDVVPSVVAPRQLAADTFPITNCEDQCSTHPLPEGERAEDSAVSSTLTNSPLDNSFEMTITSPSDPVVEKQSDENESDDSPDEDPEPPQPNAQSSDEDEYYEYESYYEDPYRDPEDQQSVDDDFPPNPICP
ncbi:hypothetical protein FGO68_gene6181 [Halteria grandinella]|uniref:Uncharacterized protein n=1 Tax=Halteria grandinella TaxID=5974 RepID=A0A8J8T173_HALGN|nr:hypothetical protein FGO68_gene6181 [Halteria grandinella]